MHPRAPVMEIRGGRDQWTTANKAGLLRLLYLAGFRVDHVSKPYSLAYGPGNAEIAGRKTFIKTAREKPGAAVKSAAKVAIRLALGGRTGSLHVAVLATPDV